MAFVPSCAGAIIENLRISGQPKPHSPQSCPGRTVAATLSSMRLSGHIIGLLKEYMRDLVEQARQESQAQEAFGFSAPPYQPDHAIADLLAILDDRIESEGVQVGLPIEFLHEMWRRCNEARSEITDRVWLETNIGLSGPSKARVRELTYLSVIDCLERESSGE
jgi:hypothetical protein